MAAPGRGAGAAIPSTWLAPASGNWTDGGKWSTSPTYPNNGTPNAGDAYDAAIDPTGNPYTVTFNGSAAPASAVTVDTLTLNSPDLTFSHAGGSLTAVSGANLNAGTIGFVGTGASLSVGAGHLITIGPTMTIRPLTQNGTLNGIIINNGALMSDTPFRTLTLNGAMANNAGAILRASGSGAILSVPVNVSNHGSIAADNFGTVTLGGSWNSDNAITATTSGTLNLGATGGTWTSTGTISVQSNATLNTAGSWSAPGGISANNATVNLGGTFSLPLPFTRTGGTVNLTGTLQNTPTSPPSLVLNSSTGSWNLTTTGRIAGGHLFTLDGTQLVGAGGTLDSLNNHGQVVVPGPGTLHLNGTWGNDASIAASAGGTLDLAGTWSNGGTISVTGGTLILAGAGTNTGTIAASAGSTVNLVTLPSPAGSLNFSNSSINVTGTFMPAQLAAVPLNGSTLTLAGGMIDATGTTLALGTSFPLQLKSGTVKNGTLDKSGVFVISVGSGGGNVTFNGVSLNTSISVAATGTLTLLGNWQNNGSITLTDSTLAVNTFFSLNQLGSLQPFGNSVLRINGTLDNSAGTSTIVDHLKWELAGTINGGTIAAQHPGNTLRVISNATMTGVTLAANASVQSSSNNKATLTVKNSLTLSGSTVSLNSPTAANAAVVSAPNAAIVGNGEIVFDGADNSGLISGLGISSTGPMTIGPGITVRTGARGGRVGDTSASTLNQGVISAGTAGQTITLAGEIINQGTIEAHNGGSITGGLSVFNLPGGTVTSAAVNSPVTFGAVGGSLTWAGGSIGGEGAVIFPSRNATITDNVVKPGSGSLRVNGNFILAAGKRLDLTTGKLIVWAEPSVNANSYTAIAGLIASGRNGGNWSGPGIVTSQSDATVSHLTSLGVATAVQVKKGPFNTALWAGVTISSNDVLVMYTYAGDATLDGKINVDDYGRIDLNIGTGASGWFNGDFNYDGKVNIDDYSIIDANLAIQGAPFATSLSSPASAAAALSAVPEPALCLTLLAPLVFFTRRRRAHAIGYRDALSLAVPHLVLHCDRMRPP